MTDASFPPPLTTDCHTHVVGGPSVYPMTSPRAYTPDIASPEDMRVMMRHVGTERIVLVQISVFGTDNTCMLDGLRTLGACARGVAQVNADVTSEELDRLHEAGVRGLRLNLKTTGVTDPDFARRLILTVADKCTRHSWHLQLFTAPPVISSLAGLFKELPIPIVFDHFGLLPVRDRKGHAETVLLDLLARGKGWVKISAPYRLDHSDAKTEIASLARDLFTANPGQIVWGSDWPHAPNHPNRMEADPKPTPYQNVDPRDMLSTIKDWFADPAERTRILVDNPARLYDYPKAGGRGKI